MEKPSKIILGIDPGTVIMGYGIIRVQHDKVSLLRMSVLKLSSKQDAYERLEQIHKSVQEIIGLFRPDACAIEAPFFGKNVQSMLKLGRAQGVAIAAAMQAGLTVTEYSPRKIKQAVTGKGNAGKEQVWKMLQRLIQLQEEPEYFDASDALAVAICHHFQTRSVLPAAGEKVKSWDEFIAKNPSRVASN
ncbi:MAG: crossover junction endodeoxyribonuclease RuvC [Williamsia sp.]|nr:crossover junction endodeoxyribonuclease RuvC [Williamsia sp.]